MSAPTLCAVDTELWASAEEVIRATGWTDRWLRAQAKNGSVPSRYSKQIAPNGRPIKEYLVTSLPDAAQRKLRPMLPATVPVVLPPAVQPGLFPPAPSALESVRLVLVDEAQIKQAMERWEILRQAVEYKANADRYRALRLRSGQPVTSATRMVLYLCEQHHISRATLFDWKRRYIAGGIPALADRQRKDKGKSHWFEQHPEAKAIVAAEYLNSHATAQRAYEALMRWWADKGYDPAKLISGETCRKWIESSDMPAALKILARDGERKHNERCLPHLRRAYEMAPMAIIVSDHMIHDRYVRNDCFEGVPDQAQMRLRLTMWLDMRTRKALGYCWTPEGSSRSIITAYRMAALRFGDPLQVYTDNGRDFIKSTKSGVKYERGPVNDQFLRDAEWLAQGALYRIGVLVQHCIKYHPQSKHIERFFRTLHMRLDAIGEHYTTGNAYNRPDPANIAMAEHKRLLVMGRGHESPLMPASQFILDGVKWIEHEHNNAPHRGEGMEGLSPNQVFDALYPPDQRRTPNRQVLDQLLFERVKRRVDSCAVRVDNRRYVPASSESAAAMYLANETEVIVCYDANARNEAIATDLDGNKIADLKVEQLMPHSAAAQPMIADSMKERRDLRNAMKDTERHIKKQARMLGHVSAEEALQRLPLPPAVGQFLSQRVPQRPAPDNHAVAPASAAEIAEAAMRLIHQ